jgi:mRNA-degrading endonuclease YafQ of YafQ-DinJ toxin-antitoxin module
VANVFWTGQAERDLMGLPENAAAALIAKVENVRRYPEMYPRMTGSQWAGCRKVFVEPHWVLIYRVMPNQDVVVMYARDTRR